MDVIELANAMGMPEKMQKDAERRAAEDAREWAHEAHMAAVERHRVQLKGSAVQHPEA